MREIRVDLDRVLKERGMTQMQLSALSGVRQAAISEITRNIREQINIRTLEKIADALEIDDISELLSIRKTEG